MDDLKILLLLVGLVVKEFIDTRGRSGIHRRIDKLDDKFVTRPACHNALYGMKCMMSNYTKHMDKRFDDLKDTIKKNGYK